MGTENGEVGVAERPKSSQTGLRAVNGEFGVKERPKSSQAGVETVNGEAGVETVNGEAGVQTLNGEAGVRTVNGEAGVNPIEDSGSKDSEDNSVDQYPTWRGSILIVVTVMRVKFTFKFKQILTSSNLSFK